MKSEFEGAVHVASVMAATNRDDPGCIDYQFAVEIEDGLVMQFLEQWESGEVFDVHFATAHFAAFSDVLLRSVDGASEFTRFEVSSAGPLFG